MLLGENGSGKSTLIKMILNHTKYEGKIIILLGLFHIFQKG